MRHMTCLLWRKVAEEEESSRGLTQERFLHSSGRNFSVVSQSPWHILLTFPCVAHGRDYARDAQWIWRLKKKVYLPTQPKSLQSAKDVNMYKSVLTQTLQILYWKSKTQQLQETNQQLGGVMKQRYHKHHKVDRFLFSLLLRPLMNSFLNEQQGIL